MEVNTLDRKYQELLRYIYNFGTDKKDRTGTGTRSVFGGQIRHKMSEGFPLLTTKKMAIKSIMTELKWFLKGDTNIKYLVENGCNIWNGDAYKNYVNSFDDGDETPLPMSEFIDWIKKDQAFAEKWGELGPIYGKQWRDWRTEVFQKDEELGKVFHATKQLDQIKNLIEELKTNPDSRRLMVNAWNVSELNEMTLPPCHYGFQVYTRELNLDERLDLMRKRTKNGTVDYDNRHHGFLDFHNIPKRAISLMWNQRSVDFPLGLPFNIASYGMLLSLLAEEVNMIPEELIGNLGDTHIYLNQVEGCIEQLRRKPKSHLPKLKLRNVDILEGEFDYEILDYDSHPTLKFPLSN